MKKPLLEGKALIERAERLGVSIGSGESHNSLRGGAEFQAAEYQIQQRVLEAERHLRESQLWRIAFASAIASIVSAVAAAVSAYFAWAAIARFGHP